MKKFIRWLADISGVTKEICREDAKEIGGSINSQAYWFNTVDKYKNIKDILHLIGQNLINYGHIGDSGFNREAIDIILKVDKPITEPHQEHTMD